MERREPASIASTRLRRWAARAIPVELACDGPLALQRAWVAAIASCVAVGGALASALWAAPLGGERVAIAVGGALCATTIPLLWATRRADPASSGVPSGLAAYAVLSTYGSGGELPFAALLIPIAALLAGLTCPRAAALGWLAVLWIGVPLAALASPAVPASPALAGTLLAVALVLAVPTLLAVALDRALCERLLADRLADARTSRAAALAQAALDERLRETEHLASLGRMAGGIAHDFNNILAAIGGNAELLAMSRQVGPEERELAARIGGSVDRASALVRPLLDFTGRGRRRLAPVRLSERATECARMLGAGISKQTTLELRVLDDARLEADPAQIDQLLVQLVQNAERAYGGKPGSIGLEIDRLDLATPAVTVPAAGLPPGAYAVVRVIDRGCGIAPGDARRVFEPFFHRFEGGRGLGLAAALGIVRGHGGGIAVQSAPGAGTAMTVFLPCDAGDDLTVDAAPAPPGAAVSLRGLRVLLVDDEPGVRSVIARHLEEQGARVIQAGDGAAALAVLAALPGVDAALVDVSMPQLSGLGLLEALRASGRDFPVVLMTGHADADVARFGADANVGVLLKPFRLDEIAVALARARRPAPGAAPA